MVPICGPNVGDIMPKIMGLYKRHGVYYYRRWVPSDVHNQFPIKELKRSLKTTDYETAVERLRSLSQDIEQQFINARTQPLYGGFNDPKVVPITGPNALEPASKSISDSQTKVTHPVQNSDHIDVIVEKVVERVLSSLGHHITKREPMTISELFNRYMADPAADRSPKSVIEYNSVFGVLTDLVGTDTSIYDVDRTLCRQVMEVLRYLPPHATKRFPGKSWLKISIIARERSLKPLSPATVNKYLASLSSLFNWAVKEELLDRNPATGLAVADAVRAKDKRLPFSDDQLKRIFSDPVFANKDYGDRPSRYWVPLIGYYSGMRLNEICQLNVEDVQMLDDVLCFHITSSVKRGVNDKVLKTPSSERVVPVHPKLLEMGFDDYRGSLSITGKLFPDIQMASNGYRSDTFTKYFQRFLLKCSAKADRTSFHSFRHNFRDALRNAGVQHDIVLALGGWVGDAGIEANYGRGYSAKVLGEAIAMINGMFTKKHPE